MNCLAKRLAMAACLVQAGAMVADGSSVDRSHFQKIAQMMRIVMTVAVEAASIRYHWSGKAQARPQPVSTGGQPVTRPGNGRRHCLSRRSDGAKIDFEIV